MRATSAVSLVPRGYIGCAAQGRSCPRGSAGTLITSIGLSPLACALRRGPASATRVPPAPAASVRADPCRHRPPLLGPRARGGVTDPTQVSAGSLGRPYAHDGASSAPRLWIETRRFLNGRTGVRAARRPSARNRPVSGSWPHASSTTPTAASAAPWATRAPMAARAASTVLRPGSSGIAGPAAVPRSGPERRARCHGRACRVTGALARAIEQARTRGAPLWQRPVICAREMRSKRHN